MVYGELCKARCMYFLINILTPHMINFEINYNVLLKIYSPIYVLLYVTRVAHALNITA